MDYDNKPCQSDGDKLTDLVKVMRITDLGHWKGNKVTDFVMLKGIRCQAKKGIRCQTISKRKRVSHQTL